MDTEPTYTTSNDIQYYRDTIAIVTYFHTIVIVSKFHYRPALTDTQLATVLNDCSFPNS